MRLDSSHLSHKTQKEELGENSYKTKSIPLTCWLTHNRPRIARERSPASLFGTNISNPAN